MSRRFLERVQAERATIKIVNATFQATTLHGLTAAAIDAWEKTVDWENYRLSRRQVIDQILDIGRYCQSLADQSRSAFDPATFDKAIIDLSLAQLSSMLDQNPSKPPAFVN